MSLFVRYTAQDTNQTSPKCLAGDRTGKQPEVCLVGSLEQQPLPGLVSLGTLVSLSQAFEILSRSSKKQQENTINGLIKGTHVNPIVLHNTIVTVAGCQSHVGPRSRRHAKFRRPWTPLPCY